MPTKQKTPCAICQAPAWGRVCRRCSMADLRSRKAAKRNVNSVGEFNAGGFSAASGIAFPKVLPTVGAWWIGAPREGFTQIGEQHAPRMSRGQSANYRLDTGHWTF